MHGLNTNPIQVNETVSLKMLLDLKHGEEIDEIFHVIDSKQMEVIIGRGLMTRNKCNILLSDGTLQTEFSTIKFQKEVPKDLSNELFELTYEFENQLYISML